MIAGDVTESSAEPSLATRIGAGLDAIEADVVALVADDLPDVDPALLASLAERRGGTNAAVPCQKDGTLHPARAVYDATTLRQAAATALATGDGVAAAILAAFAGRSASDRRFAAGSRRAGLITTSWRRPSDRPPTGRRISMDAD